MATIKFKRTTGVGAPAGGLEPGELAYAQGSNKLFIGNKAQDEHFDKIALQIETGTAGSTDFNAISGLGATLTATPSDGNVVWSTDINDPFGGNLPSIKFDGTNYLSIANDSSLNLDDIFTIEFWHYRPNATYADGTTRTFMSFRHGNSNADSAFVYNETYHDPLGGGIPKFYSEGTTNNNTGDWDYYLSGNYYESSNWRHHVLQKSSSGILISVDGNNGGTLTNIYGSGWELRDTTGPLVIGANSNDMSNYAQHLGGYFFDVRITKGVARYTFDGSNNTTVPSEAFASGAGDPQVVLDGSLVQPNTATEPTKIVVKETNASSANSLTLKASTVSSDYTLTLPTANPGSTTPLLVGSDGAMSYGDVSVATVSEIGDVGGADDPHWDNVKLLIQSNTTDGSNVFDDGSTSDHTVTASANIRHEVDQKKFGSSSIYFDGSSDIRIAESTDFDFDGAFTVETWFWRDSTLAPLGVILSHGAGTSPWNGWVISSSVNGAIELAMYHAASGPTWGILSSNSVFTNDSWNHFAMSSDGSVLKLFIDGTEVGSSASLEWGSGYPDFTFSDDGDATFNVGRRWDDVGKFKGYIEDVRVTKGVSRYPSTFAKPSETFTGAPSVLANEDLLLYSSSRTKWDTAKASTVKTLIGIGEDSNVEYENVTVNNILSVNGNSSVNSSSVVTVRDRLITLGHPPTMVSGDYSVTDGVVTVTCVQPISGTVGDNIWVDITDSQIPTGIYSMQPGDDWSGGAVTNAAYHGGSSHGTNIWTGNPTGGYYSISQQGQTVTGANGFTFVVDQGATNQGNLFHYGARNHDQGTRSISINATDASGVLRNYSYSWQTRYNSTNAGDWTDNSVIMDIVATQGEEALDGVADPNHYGGYIDWDDEDRTYRIWIETAQALPWYNNEQVGQTIRGRRTWDSIRYYPNGTGTQNNHQNKPVNTQENASYGYVTGWAYGGGSVDGGWPSIFYLTVDNWVNTGATTFKFNLSDSSITGITGQLTYSAGAITDSAVSGGGIIIPGSTQKKLQWVEDGSVSSADEWNLVGGDLKIDSGESTNTSLYVGETQKVIEVDADGQSGTIDSNFSFDENTTLTGDFDFGEFS